MKSYKLNIIYSISVALSISLMLPMLSGAQCTTFSDAGAVSYGIRIINSAINPVQYEAYATPTNSGCQLVGASQFSLVVNSEANVTIGSSNSSGVSGFNWSINSVTTSNHKKYIAVSSFGSSGGTIQFVKNTRLPLFTFTVSGTNTSNVIIFDNTSAPSSNLLGKTDYRNSFYVILPTNKEIYTANTYASLNSLTTISTFKLYPNLVQKGNVVKMITPEKLHYRLVDNSGRVLSGGVINTGATSIPINATAGNYIIETVNEQNTRQHYRLIVQ